MSLAAAAAASARPYDPTSPPLNLEARVETNDELSEVNSD